MPNSVAGVRGSGNNPLIPENRVQQVTGYDAGVNNIDPGTVIEQGILLPYIVDRRSSWLDYRCTLSIELDPGVVLHKVLPQTAQQIDTLASAGFDSRPIPVIQQPLVGAGQSGAKPFQQVNFQGSQGLIDVATGQANLVSGGKYTDFAQRMATSRYRFCLQGWAVRAAYKIPIPGLKFIGNVPAIPDEPQEVLSDSELLGNFSGVPVYFSQWRLYYFILKPPTAAQLPPPNVAEHIRADAQLPKTGIQLPYSQPDSLAVAAGTPPQQRVIRGGGGT